MYGRLVASIRGVGSSVDRCLTDRGPWLIRRHPNGHYVEQFVRNAPRDPSHTEADGQAGAHSACADTVHTSCPDE